MSHRLIDDLNWPAYLGLPVYQSTAVFKSPIIKGTTTRDVQLIEWLAIGTTFGFLALFDLSFGFLLQAFKLEGFTSIASIFIFPHNWDAISSQPINSPIIPQKQNAPINNSKLFEPFFSQMKIESNSTCLNKKNHLLLTSVFELPIRFIIGGKGNIEAHCSIWELSSDGEYLLCIGVIYNSLILTHIPLSNPLDIRKKERNSVPIKSYDLLSLLERTSKLKLLN